MGTTRAPQNPNALTKGTLEFSLATSTTRVDFQEFELPTSIENLGGQKLFALLQMAGGTRILQTFGNVPVEGIRWTGIILGQNSFDRVKVLDGIRRGAGQVTLTYGTFSFTGILAKFHAKPGFEGYIPYEAEFVPDTDLSASTTPNSTITLDTSAQQAMNLAMSATNVFAADQNTIPPSVFEMAITLQGAILQVQVAMAAFSGSLSGLAAGSPGVLGALVSNLVAANAALDDGAGNGILNTAVVSLTADGPNVISPTVLPDIVDAYLATCAAIAVLQVPLPPPVLTISVVDPNLFQIAAMYYGDATRAADLAAANGGLPFFNQGLYSLIIPA